MNKRLTTIVQARMALAACLLAASCGSGAMTDDLAPCSTAAALATCVSPSLSDAYYVEQANKYFDTLDTSASTSSIPNYAVDVARWEWSPWLKLTGLGRDVMIGSDLAVTQLGTPSTVPQRDCRAFATQPFARCRVVIQYKGGPCPIYEEFAFNAAGEMTFIEAWSDLAALLPMDPVADPWAEGAAVRRMSTKIPGLGFGDGSLDLDTVAVQRAAERDPDVADFVIHAKDFWVTWFNEIGKHGGDFSEESLYGYGCGWTATEPPP